MASDAGQDTFRLVILPGLDGTGLGLQDFIRELAPEIRAQVITYPSDRPLGYAALGDFVRERLPSKPYALLDESFSGPLALTLAQAPSPLMRAVIVAASFARLDYPFKPAWASIARLISPRMAPAGKLDRILMGARSTGQSRADLQATLAAISPQVLSLRAVEVLNVDLTAKPQQIRLPALYLRATNDRLMPRSAVETVRSIAPDIQTFDVPGPHFILQTEPQRCAAAIKTFLSSPPVNLLR